MKQIFCFLLLIYSLSADAAVETPIALEKANYNVHDIAQLQRGAKVFATYCMVCHSMHYMVHDPIAKSAGITLEKMPDKNRQWAFNVVPPDLSLVSRVHSPHWIYTYLHSFYVDKVRPQGSNNLLFDNTNMPNPFGAIQGTQVLIVDKDSLFGETPVFVRRQHYYSVLQMTSKGSMSSDEFDRMINDLVSFLVYAGEPKKILRERIGVFVLIFFALFFVIVWLLKKDYWKKIKS